MQAIQPPRNIPAAPEPSCKQVSPPPPSWTRQSGNLLYTAFKLSAAGGALAYLAGLDHGAIAACSALGAAGSAALLAAQRYSRPDPTQQTGFQAILHHAVYNDIHTLAGGLLGNLPFAALLQAGFSRLAVDVTVTPLSAAAANATLSASADLSTAAFGGLTVTAGLPLVLVSALAVGKAMRSRRSCLEAAAQAEAAPESTQAGGLSSGAEASSAPDSSMRSPLRQLHLSRATMLRVAGLSLAGMGMLVVPALALRSGGANEQALRFLILSAGQCTGNGVREIFNQLTAPAWTAVRREGEGLDYGLSAAGPDQRLHSTVVPTALSSLMFAASVGLVHALEIACGTAVVPHEQAILLMPASRFCARLALRAALVPPTLETLEALARCSGYAIYSALAGTALEYRHRHGAGLFDAPAQLARHVRQGPCYERAAMFTGARSIDASLVNLLNQIADLTGGQAGYWSAARIAAILAQGTTLARTPLVAAWVLPRRPCGARIHRRWSKPDSRAGAAAAGVAHRSAGPAGAEEEEFESISLNSSGDSSSDTDTWSEDSSMDEHFRFGHDSDDSSDIHIGEQTYL